MGLLRYVAKMRLTTQKKNTLSGSKLDSFLTEASLSGSIFVYL